MCEKLNPAVAAEYRAVLQVGIVLENPVQGELILRDKRIGTVVLVPIFRKGENLLDRYHIKARFSVMMWILLCMASSYLLDAKASRGWTRFFCSLKETLSGRSVQTIHGLITT